jgi:hypothetical protein
VHAGLKKMFMLTARVRPVGAATKQAEAADAINVKKRYVIIGLLASSLAFGQRSEKPYSKKRLKTREVQMLFSYYTQDNNHSAVTGGRGTEDLQVYTPQLTIDTRKDSLYAFHVDTGVDVISSASTDNIDFIMSSASKVDARTHLNLGYDRILPSRNATVGFNTGLSIESDYLSKALGISWNKINNEKQREVSVAFQSFFDDLRWGRLENGRPQKLIYPSELRSKEWFDTFRRNSFNLDIGIYQVINQRTALGIYPGIAYQAGLLATPFHRVYFLDENLARVENLPESRVKIPIGIQLNKFIGSRTIVRTYYRFYWDDFGITAHTLTIEAPVKITSTFNISPALRLYTQTAADFFKPYKQHDSAEKFYTSDYDLAKISSVKVSLAFRYLPITSKTFREMELRYSLYKRSDGMIAHMITTYFGFKKEKMK